jgi:hypothetical protein
MAAVMTPDAGTHVIKRPGPIGRSCSCPYQQSTRASEPGDNTNRSSKTGKKVIPDPATKSPTLGDPINVTGLQFYVFASV